MPAVDREWSKKVERDQTPAPPKTTPKPKQKKRVAKRVG